MITRLRRLLRRAALVAALLFLSAVFFRYAVFLLVANLISV